MADFQDFFAITPVEPMKNRSNRGRRKTQFFTLRFTILGRDDQVTLHPETVADLTGRSVKTVYDWISGRKTPDATTMALLEIRAAGLIPNPAWRDWRVDPVTGRLKAPNGYSFTPGELAAWSIDKQLMAALKQENALLKIRMEEMRALVNDQAANNVLPFSLKAKKNRA